MTRTEEQKLHIPLKVSLMQTEEKKKKQNNRDNSEEATNPDHGSLEGQFSARCETKSPAT